MQKRGRPLKGTSKRKRASFTLAPQDVAWLKGTASRLGISQSQLLECALHLSKPLFAADDRSAFKRLPFPVSYAQIEHFCKVHGIKKLWLFGSILKDSFGPESDIDLLVEFEPQSMTTLFELSTLQTELASMFNYRKVDLRTVKELSPYFRRTTLEQAVPLYG